MTQKNINLFQQLANIWIKIIFSVVILVCWVGVLIFIGYLIVQNQPWYNIALVTTLEAILTRTMPQLLKHYFPTNN